MSLPGVRIHMHALSQTVRFLSRQKTNPAVIRLGDTDIINILVRLTYNARAEVMKLQAWI